MAQGRRYTKKAPPRRLETAEEGSAAVRKFMIGLYEREDGRAADWPLIADALLRAAFAALDELPGDPRMESLVRRAHVGAYNRLAGNEDDGDRAMRPDAAPGANVDPRPAPSRNHRP